MFWTRLRDFVQDTSGATAVEYGLIAAGIAVAIMGVAANLGATLKGTFGDIVANLP